MSTLSDNLLYFLKSLDSQGTVPQIPFKDVGLSKPNAIVQSMANGQREVDTNIVGSRRHSLFSNDILSSLLKLQESLKQGTRDVNNPSISRGPSTVAEKLIFATEVLNSQDSESSSFSGKLSEVVKSLISDDVNAKYSGVPLSRRPSVLQALDSSFNILIDLKEAIQRHPNENNTRKSSAISQTLLHVLQPPSNQQKSTSITRTLGRRVKDFAIQEDLLNASSFDSCNVPQWLDVSTPSVLQRHLCVDKNEALDGNDIPSDEDSMLLQGHARRRSLDPLLGTQGSVSKEPYAVELPDDERSPTRIVSRCSFSVVIKTLQISTTLTIVCTNFYTEGISAIIKTVSIQTFTNIVYATTMVSTLAIILTNMCGYKPPVILVRVLNTTGAILFLAAGIANLFQWQLYLKQVATFTFNEVTDVIIKNVTSSSKTSFHFVSPLTREGTSDIGHYIVLAEGVLSVLNALFYMVDVAFSVTQAVAKKLPYLPLSRRASCETL